MHETGKSGQAVTDDDVLEMAIAEARAVLTLNRKHFIQLHRHQPGHAGIIVCTADNAFVAQAHRIHAAIGAETDVGRRLIRVNRPGSDNPGGSAPGAAP